MSLSRHNILVANKTYVLKAARTPLQMRVVFAVVANIYTAAWMSSFYLHTVVINGEI